MGKICKTWRSIAREQILPGLGSRPGASQCSAEVLHQPHSQCNKTQETFPRRLQHPCPRDYHRQPLTSEPHSSHWHPAALITEAKWEKQCSGWNVSPNCMGRKGTCGKCWIKQDLSVSQVGRQHSTTRGTSSLYSHTARPHLFSFPQGCVHSEAWTLMWFLGRYNPHPLSSSFRAEKLCKPPTNLAPRHQSVLRERLAHLSSQSVM